MFALARAVVRADRRYGALLVLGLMLFAGPLAHAACKTPLPSPELRDLDASVDTYPLKAVAQARQRLQDGKRLTPLESAELQAIIADAYDTSDDDSAAKAAIAAGKSILAGLPAGAEVADLQLRLDLVGADVSESADELNAALHTLNGWEPRLNSQSLGHACLLLVRGRLQGRLNQYEQAARDGLAAYQLASDIGSKDGVSEAAYQLGITFRRAGLYDAALQMEEQVVSDARAKGQKAVLASALYTKAQILNDMGRPEAALPVLDESSELSRQLNDVVGVAFVDHQRCHALVALKRLDDAERACFAAERQFAASSRPDQRAAVSELLAQIDLSRGRPAAALKRLETIVAAGDNRVPPAWKATFYRDLSDALAQSGRSSDALAALQKSRQLSERDDLRQRSLAVATLNAQQELDRHERERQTLRRELQLEREQEAARDMARRLAIGLAVAGALVSALFIVLFMISRRHARDLRRQETILRETSMNAPDALALLDANGNLRFANRGLFGVGDLPPVGRPIADSAPAEARAAVEAAVRKLIVERQAVSFDISVNVAGRPRHIELRGIPIVEHEHLLGATVRASDVTELRILERATLDAASAERQRLSSDLHEGLGQELTGISLLLRTAVTAAQRGHSEAVEMVADSIGHLDQAIQSTRDLARGLSPVQTEQGSLSVALARLAVEAPRRFQIRVTASSQPPDIHVPVLISDQLYRIAYEAVVEAGRLGRTTCIAIELSQGSEVLHMSLTDDGLELGRADAQGAGLASQITEYRVRLAGGTIQFTPLAEGGTRAVVSVPRRAG